MTTTWKSTTAISAGALLVLFASLAGAGLPADVQNVWAPAGERIGLENHWALGYTALDQYGSPSKSLEDWQLGEDHSAYGLFSYSRRFGTERHLSLRGYGTNADGKDLTGRFVGRFETLGKRTLTVKHRGYNYFSDATSEIRARSFAAGPVPIPLDVETGLAWCRNEADLRYHVNDRLDLSVGALRSRREGAKGSLLRQDTNVTAPGLKTFDTEIMEVRWGGAAVYGPVAGDLRMSYRKADGDRALDDRRRMTDDQTQFTTQLGATYDIAPDTRVLGHYVNARIENETREVAASVEYAPSTQATTNAGGLAVVRRVGTHALVNLSAAFKAQNASAQESIDEQSRFYRDRDRSSQEYRAAVRYNGLAKTRLEAFYRFRASNLEEATTAYADYGRLGGITLAEVGDTQAAEVDKTRQEFGLKARYRFGRKAKLSARLNWSGEDVEQSVTRDSDADLPWFFWMGDRKTSRLNWRLALQTRPAKTVNLDLGYRMNNRDFELEGDGMAETSWQSHSGFAAATWRAHEKVTLYGNASLGRDKSELSDAPETAGALDPIAYDGTTWRFAPGAVLQLTSKLQFEAQYEGIRFEDDGGDADLYRLNTDYDRTTLRVRYRVMERASAAFSYRRYEFDENRWDDTINDLYTLSLAGSF